jgi:hypothetical protein
MAHGRETAERTTYFLGAGASAAVCESALVTSNLLALALRTEPVGSRVQDLALAGQFVRMLSSAEQEPAIDDVLSLIDLAISAGLSFSSEWPRNRLISVRESLNRLVYDCVQTTIHDEEPTVNDPLSTLLNKCETESASTIVTLNWDCLVERVYRRLRNQNDGVIDYGIPCVRENGEPFAVDPGALIILKPHGSLSWGYCPLCSTVVADLTLPFDFTKNRPCPVCPRVPLQFVLVPPVPFVQMWPWFLSALWDKVEQAIYQCDRLVFIGYSFPSQDVGVRVRLVRALARRKDRLGAVPLRVEVVTKEEGARTGSGDEIRHRYLSLLGGQLRPEDVVFCGQGFSKWAASGMTL